MTVASAMQLINDYGVFVLFGLALLEAMNCPGMPAGVLLPAAGVFVAGTGSLRQAALVYASMVVGAFLGCVMLYCVGALGGKALEHWLKRHSGKRLQKIEHYLEKLHNGSWRTICLCRLMPVVRTLGSLLAGISRMDMRHYLVGTAAGIAVYNAVGIGLGYFAGWLFI